MVCPRCKNNTPILTRDHVIPQILGKMCQRYGVKGVMWQNKENIEMVCPNCNFSKGHKIDTEEARMLRERLLELHWAKKIYIKSSDLKILAEMTHSLSIPN